MPRKKGQKRRANLGDYAQATKKQKLRHEESLSDHQSMDQLHLLRDKNPSCDSDNDDEDNQSGITTLSNLSEDEDLSMIVTTTDLLCWLKSSRQTLRHLRAKLRSQPQTNERKNYHTNHLHSKPSARTERHHQQQDREQTEREEKENRYLGIKATKLTQYFGAMRQNPTEQNPSIINPSIIDVNSSDESEQKSSIIDVDSLDEFDWSKVTGETGEDKDETRRQESAEEGLDLPEIVWEVPRQEWMKEGELLFTEANTTFTWNPLPNSSKPGSLNIPTPTSIDSAITALSDILHPPRRTGRGFKIPDINHVVHARLELMLGFMRLYKAAGYTGWERSSDEMAVVGGKGPWLARMIRQWAISFCLDHSNLLVHEYGKFNTSIIEDEDIAADIHLHLQSLGKWIRAEDIVHYVGTPEFQARLKIKKGISVRTAQRWMKRMEYHWKAELKGQYSDGHEREDNVEYRQKKFLPVWKELESVSRWWKEDGTEDGDARERVLAADPNGRVVVIWRHDESIFYGNDHRKIRWIHSSETAKPYAKGEGASLMVGDFVSPDYGWLKGKETNSDGSAIKSARKFLRPGKTRNGYQTTEDIIEQATIAMDILDTDYPDEQHVFAYDNATIHTARAPNALSATGMPVNPHQNYLCKVKDRDRQKERTVRIKNGTFRDGTVQELYYPDCHPKYPGWFKGTCVLIQERREKGHDLPDVWALKNPGSKFFKINGACKKKCKCWGYAKRVYRMFPTSSLEANLKTNTISTLESVPLVSMRRFATRSLHFADSYFHGLSGAEAAWANKKYRGHRTIPPDFRAELDVHFHKNTV
ncbi:hypothetical protein GGU11DRAFT_757552 [Lentinula aff. detonsa]|nr:hypothetical protein GGU11DRAFT_757552 [Lentinula aff. detonsa]